MTRYHNIERALPGKPYQYIGYAHGLWTIRRQKPRGRAVYWVATRRDTCQSIQRDTLAAISAALDKVAPRNCATK